MTNQPIHILNEMGVITSFSVAKKITEEDIQKFFINGKKRGKSDPEIERMLREKIVGDIETAIVEQKIPGLITPQEMAQKLGLDKDVIKNLPELNRLVMVIAHKLSDKSYDKMSLCYLINSLVNILSLSEEDFEKFHRQNNKDAEEESDDDDTDNDGEESGTF